MPPSPQLPAKPHKAHTGGKPDGDFARPTPGSFPRTVGNEQNVALVEGDILGFKSENLVYIHRHLLAGPCSCILPQNDGLLWFG